MLAAVVGLATLRVSGVYFVIFSLGLAELVRQIMTWLQHVLGTMSGLYVTIERSEPMYYWQLLLLAAAIFLVGWRIGRSRLGFALRIIGNDELVAVHCGINTARAKVVLFVISSMFASIAGALVAPRWGYVEPVVAFSPFLSFQVVIMALLGGTHRLWGPLLGVIPFVLVWELIAIYFPLADDLAVGRVLPAHRVRHSERPDRPRRRRDRPAQKASRPAAGRRAASRRGFGQFRRAAGCRRGQEIMLSPATIDALTAAGVTKRFGGLVAVDNMSFKLAEKEVLGLIGPNGSGKTTMMNLISGALKPSSGEISVYGETVTGIGASKVAKKGIARTFQLVRMLPTMTVLENVAAGGVFGHARRWGKELDDYAHALLQRVGLPNAANAPVSALTYIDQKRLELARALASDPKILLLDEWLAGLNPDRAADRDRADRATALGRMHDHHRRACHARDPQLVRPLHRHE